MFLDPGVWTTIRGHTAVRARGLPLGCDPFRPRLGGAVGPDGMIGRGHRIDPGIALD